MNYDAYPKCLLDKTKTIARVGACLQIIFRRNNMAKIPDNMDVIHGYDAWETQLAPGLSPAYGGRSQPHCRSARNISAFDVTSRPLAGSVAPTASRSSFRRRRAPRC